MVACKVCGKEYKNNSKISYHVKAHHGYSVEQYFLEFFGEVKFCNVCGEKCRFVSLTKGYHDRCGSKECGMKWQWSKPGSEERRNKQSDRFSENNPSVGRPKGSKNKNPYPMTPQNIEKIDKFANAKKPWNRSPEKINKQKATWAAKTFEEITEIIQKRTIKNVGADKEAPKFTEEQLRRAFNSISKFLGLPDVPEDTYEKMETQESREIQREPE